MAQQDDHCFLPHKRDKTKPTVGVSILQPSPAPRSILDLLGINDQELQEQMAKGHPYPYAFHMGGGKSISFENYQEAAMALMKRNMPGVLHNRQKEVVFIPEAHLPKVPRVVDLQAFEIIKKSLDDETLASLGMRKGRDEVIQAMGDNAERHLAEELKEIFANAGNKNGVVPQGGTFRVPGKGKGAIEEHDFIIIDKENKLVICIESKVNLSGFTGQSAVEQTKKLKNLLEEYFASVFTSGQWCFVGMIFSDVKIKSKQSICPTCSPFIIQGTRQLATKLNGLREEVQKVRPHRVVPSHPEYVTLVKGLAFVVFSHPISTYCTIASDVHAKVVGKPATGKTKAKSGQGDVQSIVFWTNQQAKIMLWDQQYVFFIGPWSTGKTLLMREKAVMWARQNPTESLFFVVVRYQNVKKTSLLEMELRHFFHQQHNLHNVEVFGLPTQAGDALSRLLKKVTTRPPGSWMVDELIMPEPQDHWRWTKDLEKLQSHMTAKNYLWITCAGIRGGEPEHFEHDYLTRVLPPVFHLPKMDVPLRNTKQVLALARLKGNRDVKGFGPACSTRTNPVYKVPADLMQGIRCKQLFFNDIDGDIDEDEVASVVKAACKEVLRRTGGAGFPVLCNSYDNRTPISVVKRGLERAGATALVYHKNSEVNSSEAEVEEWLRSRRRGEEKRCLITDEEAIWGWEASHTLVVAMGGYGWENLVMRTVGYCVLVKPNELDY